MEGIKRGRKEGRKKGRREEEGRKEAVIASIYITKYSRHLFTKAFQPPEREGDGEGDPHFREVTNVLPSQRWLTDALWR
jgi:hypothetical protein